jgi:hypothetical protein
MTVLFVERIRGPVKALAVDDASTVAVLHASPAL